MNRSYDVIVIGAGISGLSLAHYCKNEGLKTLVIEKSKRIGGALYSYYFQDIDFWIELGAHTCYNSYTNLIRILEEISAIDKITGREKVPFKMFVGGKIKSIPSELNLLELLFSAPKVFLSKKGQMSVREYYSMIVGKTNYEKVISPALSAVISQNADDFPADMLFKRRSRRKDILKKFSLQRGLQTIAESIASRNGLDVLSGESINIINYKGDHFEVISETATYASGYLAFATPALSASILIKQSFPSVSEALSKIDTKKVESMGVAVKAETVRHIPPVAGIIPRSDLFYSIVSRDTVKDSRYRGFTFHFKPDISDRDTKLTRIEDVLGIKEKDLEYYIETNNFIPALKKGHKLLINHIDSLIAEKPLLLTGNYFEGLAIEDCIIRSLKEFSRLKKMLGNGKDHFSLPSSAFAFVDR